MCTLHLGKWDNTLLSRHNGNVHQGRFSMPPLFDQLRAYFMFSSRTKTGSPKLSQLVRLAEVRLIKCKSIWFGEGVLWARFSSVNFVMPLDRSMTAVLTMSERKKEKLPSLWLYLGKWQLARAKGNPESQPSGKPVRELWSWLATSWQHPKPNVWRLTATHNLVTPHLLLPSSVSSSASRENTCWEMRFAIDSKQHQGRSLQ